MKPAAQQAAQGLDPQHSQQRSYIAGEGIGGTKATESGGSQILQLGEVAQLLGDPSSQLVVLKPAALQHGAGPSKTTSRGDIQENDRGIKETCRNGWCLTAIPDL